MKHIDRKQNKPTLSGELGEAWRIDLEAVRKTTGQPDTAVDAWIVYAPFASHDIHYYAVLTMHLRDDPVLGPAEITVPGATHEIQVHPLNPEAEPQLADPMRTILKPTKFAGQWDASGDLAGHDDLMDHAAQHRTERAVTHICNGILTREVTRDTLEPWAELFGTGNVWPHVLEDLR